MLRVLNLTSTILYAIFGLFTLAVRLFADHPVGYSMELFTVDLTILFSAVACIGFFALQKQKKFGLTMILVATAVLLILAPFTEQVMLVPVYVVLAIVAWLVFRQIGKPASAKS